MTVRRRTIWLSDEEWTKAQERAAAFSLNVSQYIGKLIEWRQPGPRFVEEGVRGQDPIKEAANRFVQFRPVPKPGARK